MAMEAPRAVTFRKKWHPTGRLEGNGGGVKKLLGHG
jgi:hypothetical protein